METAAASGRMSSAGRALRILQALLAADYPPTHAELVRSLDIPKSTLSSVISELRELGYITESDRRYFPGPQLLVLGYQIAHVAGLGQGAGSWVHPLLERLAAVTGETVTFSVEVGRTDRRPGSILALDFVPSPNVIRYVPGIGRLQPIHRAAAGRVLLAFSHRSAADLPAAQFVPATPSTLVTAEAVDAELELTRQRGYALNREETIKGVTAIAGPVLDADGRPLAAITVLGPSARVGDPAATIWPVLGPELAAVRFEAVPGV